MSWRMNRPLVDILTGHWISMTGTALVTLAGFSWLFLLPMHMSGHANDPYIGLLAFVALPLMFFTGLVLIPIGAALGQRRVEGRLATAVDRRAVWRRAGIFFAVMTAANLVIASQLSYRAVTQMESVQFCGQTCHVMKPEFTAHMRPSHTAVDCVACHIRPGATGFVEAKMAGTRQLWNVILNNYPRPIESAMESNRLVSSAETCEQCHERARRMTPKLRVITKYKDDEANTPNQTVLMVMVDKIHAAHLASGVAVRYAAADRKRQTIPWVEYRDASGATRSYLTSDAKPDQIAAMPKFEMQCVDCHNRAAHSFEVADRAVDGAISFGQIPGDLPFVKKTSLAVVQGQYASPDDASAKIAAQLNDFYRQKYPDVAARRANDINGAARTLTAIYNRNVFSDLKVTWGTYPNNLGHADYPGCFRCHDGSHVTKTNESITQDCAACHNVIAVEESSPEVLKTLGLSTK
ncbi:MAG: NapC/NirT family cytochrome c [Bryobacteraceae bacterium]